MSEPTPLEMLERIVAELRRYPIDAFMFIQECVGLAAERVHGPMSQQQQAIHKWMYENGVSPAELPHLAARGELPGEMAEAIDQAGGPQRLNRHVTGQQLCVVIRDVALERWGLMAGGVLARWNIRRTEDIGAIIFALVEKDLLQKEPTDTIEDFEGVFDFDEAFDHSYQIR
jgi:uncharacterized repeat protein (TIGR04138 family)